MDGGGTKLKLLDAFAMSKAVLAHPIGCEGLAVTDGKNVLMADTDGRFISGIQHLIADEPLRRRLEIGARELAELHYSYDAIGEKLANLYQRLSIS
jgi:glycosyltransferase involved in cell wall biosynthesis